MPKVYGVTKCILEIVLLFIRSYVHLIKQFKLVADPYVRVTFLNQSQKTKTLPQSLCPTWDQTLIFKELKIYDDPRESPPSVVIELFDEDKVWKFKTFPTLKEVLDSLLNINYFGVTFSV